MHAPRLAAPRTLLCLCALALLPSAKATQITDRVLGLDNQPFNGIVSIVLQTAPGATPPKPLVRTVINGHLDIDLIPNPSPLLYEVDYKNSDGSGLLETWSVPYSKSPLRIANIRQSSSPLSASRAVDLSQTVQMSSVTGLNAALAMKPQRGVGYGVNKVVFSNDEGNLETVVGDPGDCVFTDGTAGPCGASPNFADAETPAGILDGTNRTFSLANLPSGSSLLLFRNGLFMTPGMDYTLNGSTIQFVLGASPQSGDILTASYRTDPTTDSSRRVRAVRSLPRGSGADVLCSAPGSPVEATSWASLGACRVPLIDLQPGDRIIVTFNLSHASRGGDFDLRLMWNDTLALNAHGTVSETSIAGRLEAVVGQQSTSLSAECWGHLFTSSSTVAGGASQEGVKVELLGQTSASTSDSIQLVDYLVLRSKSTLEGDK
jgi:hypothetical protein